MTDEPGAHIGFQREKSVKVRRGRAFLKDDRDPKTQQLSSLEQVRSFIAGTAAVLFTTPRTRITTTGSCRA